MFIRTSEIKVNGGIGYAADTGATNAYVANPNSPIAGLLDAVKVVVKITSGSNTVGAPTLNVSGTGAVTVVRNDTGGALNAGDIILNAYCEFVYDGVNGVWRLLPPPTSIAPTVTPSGAVISYAGSSAPSGWLLCDGSAVSRTTYAALFTAIGTTFGAGDGSTTFNVPDGRGRSFVGVGQGSGLTNRTLAATGGEETHALSVAELASHSHTATVTDPGHLHSIGISSQLLTPGGGTDVMRAQSSTNTNTATTGITVANANAGSGTAHNNMQPFLALNYIIKT